MSLPRAHGGPGCQGHIKHRPDDFRVFEQMQVQPEGEGEHLWLHIEKTGWNTEDVALWLAKAGRIHRLSVGYSGLKDKHAVTRQWFSLHLPGKADPAFDWPPGLALIGAGRHRRKLNRGTHRANAFELCVRDLQGDRQRLEQQLGLIGAKGVPNYFGEQRFGRLASNLERGRDWLLGGEAPRKKALKGLWLSAVRSDLFNRVLAERVAQGCWAAPLSGDILQPEGSRGLFYADDEPLAAQRVAQGDVHPTAPLPGVPGMASSGACRELETAILNSERAVIEGLQAQGVEEARRATRLPVRDLQWQWQGDQLLLSFMLPTGAFATTVLAELVSTPGD
ncbi:MAG: tRNA pseudouridine(13) synthase TruD [Alcanivorax sp.]|nr:tRNA pseudouridine(13) synthase TruD [Alcanivorax sp.]